MITTQDARSILFADDSSQASLKDALVIVMRNAANNGVSAQTVLEAASEGFSNKSQIDCAYFKANSVIVRYLGTTGGLVFFALGMYQAVQSIKTLGSGIKEAIMALINFFNPIGGVNPVSWLSNWFTTRDTVSDTLASAFLGEMFGAIPASIVSVVTSISNQSQSPSTAGGNISFGTVSPGQSGQGGTEDLSSAITNALVSRLQPDQNTAIRIARDVKSMINNGVTRERIMDVIQRNYVNGK